MGAADREACIFIQLSPLDKCSVRDPSVVSECALFSEKVVILCGVSVRIAYGLVRIV